MARVLFAMVALVFAASVTGGCRAEGEVGEAAAPVVAPR